MPSPAPRYDSLLERTTRWIAAVSHGVLCLLSLTMAQTFFPAQDGLYFWWFAPLDGVCLLLTPLFVWNPGARLASLAVTTLTGLQALAVFFLGYHAPPNAGMAGFLILFYALRCILARRAVSAVPPMREVRRCRA